MYRIQGLSPAAFEPLVALSDGQLAERGAMRVTADAKPGFPCRVTLEDAEPGESLLLLNHVSHDVATPYRAAYAIYVRERAGAPALFEDSLPPVFAGRTLSLRGFDAHGMLRGAVLALPGEGEARIKELFERPEIATIHVHNAAYGCFVARVERN
jgi:hypothetical protein